MEVPLKSDAKAVTSKAAGVLDATHRRDAGVSLSESEERVLGQMLCSVNSCIIKCLVWCLG